MRGLLILLVLFGLTLPGLTAPVEMMRAGSTNVQPRPDDQSAKADRPAEPVNEAETKESVKTPSSSTNVHFYGHAFLYMTTSSGVRIAFNPFPKESQIGYQFPKGLATDIVLISAESADLSANDGFSGLPQVFRSLTGLGVNNANGIQFRGVATYRDGSDERTPRGNTAYLLETDRLVFCDLGAIGQPLNKRQAKDIGRVDVLFLPIGNPQMSVADLWSIVEQTQAKWVVPVMYRTPKSVFTNLRTLDDFLAAPESVKYPKINLDSSDYVFNYKNLPKEPTLLIYQSP